MAKRIAPVELTGGEGFDFEDKVAAKLLLDLISGIRSFGAEFGAIVQLDWQSRDVRWLLDDLVVTGQGASGPDFAAMSIKSYRQLTSRGFPQNFVQAAWEQWLHTESDAFREGRDLLCLCTGELAGSVETAWQDMLRESIRTDPSRMASRLTTSAASQVEKAIFDSLQCPLLLRERGRSDAIATAKLLRHIRVLHFDFQTSPSADEAMAIKLCQESLVSGDAREAERLWMELRSISADRRTAGGSLSLSQLAAQIRRSFRLRAHPDHKADWDRLALLTEESMAIIRTDTAGCLSVLRGDAVAAVQERLETARFLVLTGDSGCGKSALAKRVALSRHRGGLVVWFDRDTFSGGSLLAIEEQLGLRNRLESLMSSSSATQGLLVLDGIDRMSPAVIRAVGTLLGNLAIHTVECPWQVLATSQLGAWEDIGAQVAEAGVPRSALETLEVPDLAPAEIREVLRLFPALWSAALGPDVLSLLGNPKILDWVAHEAAKPSGILRGWAGLADVIEWVWGRWVGADERRHARERVLMRLAEAEADVLASGIPLNQLEVSEAEVIGSLESLYLLTVRDARVRFTHDLLGDWARLRVLVGEQVSSVDRLTPLAGNPRWHRAIRLYAVRLLEAKSGDTSLWRALVAQSTDDEVPAAQVARDVLLESVIFAANAEALLERVWPILAEDQGRLLNRLLMRFLHVATVPDPRIPELAENQEMASRLMALMRVPYWPYWLPFLRFLHRHSDVVSKVAIKLAAEVCGLWLRVMPRALASGQPLPLRPEAAQVLLELGREVQGLKAEELHFHDDEDEKIYEQVLYAAFDLPDEVSALALELCRRRDEAPEITAMAEEHRRRMVEDLRARLEASPELKEQHARLATERPFFHSGPLRQPWPDGPSLQVDTAFQNACLNTKALGPLIEMRPDVAREVLLALCIEQPTPDDEYLHERLLEHFDTEPWIEGSPPMYFRGPFLDFLHLRPEQGLEAVLRLVNFATERWQPWERRCRQQYDKPSQVFSVTVHLPDGPAEWLGDMRVYGWYRNRLLDANAVASALMALEKWLYEELEQGNNIDRWIDTIAKRSRSVAFAGVLSAVGRKEPRLLEGALRWLLGVWQIYDWELQLLADDQVWRIDMMTWSREGERIFNAVRDWQVLPHREQSLRHLAVRLLFANPKMAELFDAVRARWTDELGTRENRDSLELLIARFDPSNYRLVPVDEHRFSLQLEWPEHLRARTAQALQESTDAQLLIYFPSVCRSIVDGEKALQQEELPRFWDELQRIAKIEAPADLQTHSPVENSVCGGIAVLLARHAGWLRSDQARKEWCLERVNAILEQPPQPPELEVAESVTTTRWDCFLGDIAIALLAASPADPAARPLVAQSLASYYYAVTKITLRAAFRERGELGDDFIRMQNFVVLWAGLRAIHQTLERFRCDVRRWGRLYELLLSGFVNRTIPAELLDWDAVGARVRARVERVEQSARRGRAEAMHHEGDPRASPASEEDGGGGTQASRRRQRQTRALPVFDVQVLEHGFAWVPALSAARGPMERQQWIKLTKNLLGITLAMVELDDDSDAEIEGTPYDFDRWAFGRVVSLLPQLRADEHPDSFWAPILDLGSRAHYWVESFLGYWFLEGQRLAGSATAFVRCWRPMIEHALSSPEWDRNSGRSTFRVAEMWLELMGLSSNGISGEEFAGPLGGLLPLYERWAHQWLALPRAATSFAAFLSQPAARRLLLPGIRWLSAGVSSFEEYDWHHFDGKSACVTALRTCWERHRNALQTDAELRNAFLRLLTLLVRRQEPAALELHDVVARAINTGA